MNKVVRLAVDNPPPAKTPSAPAGLGKTGKEEWNRVAPLLMRDGTIPAEIEGLLLLYCQNVERAQLAARDIRKQGQTYKSPAGLKAHPMIRAEAVASQNALRIAEKLGIVGTTKPPKPSLGSSTSLVD